MEENALDRLEAFASLNGPRFYGLPANEERITLQAKPLDAPEQVEVPGGNKSIVVFRPDTPVGWSSRSRCHPERRTRNIRAASIRSLAALGMTRDVLCYREPMTKPRIPAGAVVRGTDKGYVHGDIPSGP